MAPLAPSFWKSKRAFQISVSKRLVRPRSASGLAGVAEELLEDMKQGHVVNELRRLVLVELLEVGEDVLLHVLDQRVVVPDLVEPLLEFLPVAVAVDDQVQLDVVAAGAQAQAADGEIGTAENGVFHAGVGDVVHLAVQQVGLPDGPDFHLPLDPIGALLGDALLLKPVRQFQAVGVDEEDLLLGLARVEPVDEGRLAEKEVEVVDAFQDLLERVVGVNREVGGDNGEAGTARGSCP